MDLLAVLRVLAYVVGIVLASAAVWAVFELVETVRSVRTLSDALAADLPPLIDRANNTLDAANVQIRRVDGVVTQIEEVSDRVSTTTRAAQDLVEVPVAAVSGLAEGARRFVATLLGRG